MPRGDQTGPAGMGRMTGRGMGFCTGYNVPGYANPGFGRGMGYGFGRGRGFGRGFRGRFLQAPVQSTYEQVPYAPYQAQPVSQAPVKEDHIKMLEEEKRQIELETKLLEQDLQNIKKRIKELE